MALSRAIGLFFKLDMKSSRRLMVICIKSVQYFVRIIEYNPFWFSLYTAMRSMWLEICLS